MTKGETTRQRIIAEAAPIFNQRGFEGASMQDIMQATGLEKGGLYRHFSSKEELAVEAFRYALDRSVRLKAPVVPPGTNAVDHLCLLVEHFVASKSGLPGGCPLMNTAIDSDDGNPALRDLARKGIQNWQARLTAIVDAGLKRGEIRKGTLSRRIANTLIATLEGALMMARIEGRSAALQDAQESLIDMLRQLAPDRELTRQRHTA